LKTNFYLALFVALAWLAARPDARAGTLSDPSVDTYNCRMSTTMIGGKYQFTTNNILVEGAMVLTNLGINSYKFVLNNSSGGYITLPSNITNLMLEARDVAPYRTVFDMPTLKHYVFWCYTFKNSQNSSWNNGFTSTEQTNEYNEIYALSRYFLTNYNNSGKSFYLGHWEGDWSTGLSTSGTTTNNPTPTSLQGMIDWLNTRQKAVDDAMNGTPHTNVNVFNYTEVNRVADTVNDLPPYTNRVINKVVPYVTNLDYVSWSSYDIQSKTNVTWWLDYAASFIPTNKAAKISGKRLFIGEFGWGSLTEAEQAPLIQAYDQTLFAWGCPFSFYWELYDNETNADGTYKHFDLIYTNGTDNANGTANPVYTANYWLYDYYWNNAKLAVLSFKQQNGRLPTDTEFGAIAATLLNSTLTPPVSLALTAGPPTQTGSTSATLNGNLTQGIYGDTFASVKMYWGPSGGGTNRNAWTNVLALGVNTNAGTVNYNPLVANLPSEYYYAYYATNSDGDAWSPTAHVQSLNPQNYGSAMQVTFGGYNQGETLVNFPVLICLSTNLPGFSYSQFASPTGGDLRFCDASGYVLLPHEIDEWNTNGTSSVWVQMPALSGPMDSLWAYWGNAAATNPPGWTTNGAVWSNGYDLAWHLKESGLPYADSVQQHPGTFGTVPTSTTGLVGKGIKFNGSSQYVSPGTMNLSNAFTISVWVNVTNTASSIQTVWANRGGTVSNGFALYVNGYGTSDQSLVLETGTGPTKAKTATNLVTFGQWHYVNAVVDRGLGGATLYVDGANQTVSSSIDSGFAAEAPVNLGRFSTNSGTGYNFKGLMDEARIESVARSANWVWASYLTVASNSALASYAGVTRAAPWLSLKTMGTGGLIFNWPASAVNYSLYATTNLATASWNLVTNIPALVNSNNVTQWQLSIAAGTNSARFYRLMTP